MWLIRIQCCFRLWLDAIGQQAIAWANDPGLCRYMALLSRSKVSVTASKMDGSSHFQLAALCKVRFIDLCIGISWLGEFNIPKT